jgi:hypothetical protein
MTTPLDPSLYPASYRTSVWRGVLRILVIMTLTLIVVLLQSHIIERGGPRWLLIAIVLGLLFFLVILANVTFGSVTLYPDHIERVTWFGKKSMLRADVVKLARRRLFIVFPVPILVSRRGPLEGVQLPTGIEEDAAWEAWMTVARDTDAVQVGAAPDVGLRS